MKYMVAELLVTAKKVWYENGMVCILIQDGREIRFPSTLNKRLKYASRSQLENIEIICGGTGLHWPELDEDLSIVGIMEGRFGQ